MRIGVDLRPLQGETQYRGIGKALEFLLRAMLEKFSADNAFVFYADDDLPVPQIAKEFAGHKIIPVPSSRLGRKRYFRSFMSSYQTARPLKRDVDVFLQYDAGLGVPVTVPCVTVFHDLIPLLFRPVGKKQTANGLRRHKNTLAGNLYWRKYLRTLGQYKRAKCIIAISEASKQDYVSYVDGSNKQKVVVIPHGTNTFSSKTQFPKQIKLSPSTPYLLYVGGIDLRKNVVGLLKTFYELKQTFPDLRLVVVGKEFSLHEQLADFGWFKVLNSNEAYAEDVLTPGFIADQELSWLYQHATAFVFPSRYEGFGLPVLEAMQAGCPVVAYNNSSIPEVAGDAAILVPDGESLVPAITKLLRDPVLHEQLISKGKLQAKKFTWERTAQETFMALKKAVE